MEDRGEQSKTTAATLPSWALRGGTSLSKGEGSRQLCTSLPCSLPSIPTGVRGRGILGSSRVGTAFLNLIKSSLRVVVCVAKFIADSSLSDLMNLFIEKPAEESRGSERRRVRPWH